MNDTLYKLMIEAGYAAPHLADRATKLAELIVRECAQFTFVLDAAPVSHKSAARMLQEHFGVKE